MTDKLKAAAEMALEALEDTLALCINYKSVEDADGYVFTEASDVIKQGESAHKALRQALDQLPDTTKMIDTGTDRGAWTDVPDATKWVDDLRGDDEFECPRCGHCCWTPEDMAYRPNGLSVEESPNSTTDVVESEQKPFGYFQYDMRLSAWVQNRAADIGVAFYTAPPKREWVGLTDEEIGTLTVFDGLHHVEVPLLADFARAIEAKLKEKNHEPRPIKNNDICGND